MTSEFSTMTTTCLCLAVLPLATAAQENRTTVDVSAVYTGDAWSNLAGGIREGSAYLDNFDFVVQWDAKSLPLFGDTQFLLYGLYNNGTSFARDIVGDLQVVSNIETGVQAFRLYEAWINFGVGERGNLLFGLYDLNREFDVLEASLLFLNSAHGIGTDISQSGLNGPSIFPVTSLSLRYAIDFNKDWSLRVALLDGVPGDLSDLGDTEVSISHSDGALLIGELERTFDRAKLLAGAWGYTAEFSQDPLGVGAATQARRGNAGAYLRGETVLFDDGSKVSVFGRIGIAHGDYNPFGFYFGAGVTWRGAIAARPDDSLGFAIAWAETSDHVLQLASSASVPVDSREIDFELTYHAVISKRLQLQPNLQYIVNPGLVPERDDALAVGLRFIVDLWPD